MKTLLFEEIHPLPVEPGDTLELTYQPPIGPEQVVLHQTITAPTTFDAAVIFALEPDDLPGVNLEYGLGGAFLSLRRPRPRQARRRWRLPWMGRRRD